MRQQAAPVPRVLERLGMIVLVSFASCATLFTICTVGCGWDLEAGRHVRAIDMIIALKTACDAYRMHHGQYPATLERLTEPSGKNGNEPYVKNVPKDPYGKEFVYRLVSPDVLQLSCTAPNGEPITLELRPK